MTARIQWLFITAVIVAVIAHGVLP